MNPATLSKIKGISSAWRLGGGHELIGHRLLCRSGRSVSICQRLWLRLAALKALTCPERCSWKVGSLVARLSSSSDESSWPTAATARAILVASRLLAAVEPLQAASLAGTATAASSIDTAPPTAAGLSSAVAAPLCTPDCSSDHATA